MKNLLVAMLFFVGLTGTAAAQNVSDVSKWGCGNIGLFNGLGYNLQTCLKDGNTRGSYYVTSPDGVVFIHEHRLVGGEEKYYSAIKTDSGEWKEIIQSKDPIQSLRILGPSLSKQSPGGPLMVLQDNYGKIIGTRNLP